MSESCLICDEPLSVGKTCHIGPTGNSSLHKASDLRHDGLGTEFSTQTEVVLHVECRKRYTRPGSIKADTQPNDDGDGPTQNNIKTRGCSERGFDFEKDCVYCSEDAKVSVKVAQKYRKSVSKCETLDLQDSIRSQCLKRNDEWGSVLLGRLENINDLPAAEGRYHRACFFRLLF